MHRYLLRRLLWTIPVVIGITLLVFASIRLAPGDPLVVLLGANFDPRAADVLRHELGLDRPLAVQYLLWLSRVVRGDLGRSIFSNQSVLDLIVERIPTTLTLAGMAVVFSLVVAIPAGILAATRRGWFDSFLQSWSALGVSMPVFWVGLLLIIFFSLKLGWLPPGGTIRDHGLRALVLPTMALSMSFSAVVAQLTRSSMIEALTQDYVRTAQAKGLTHQSVLIRHALPNALMPVVTVTGLQLGILLGGAVLTETIFSLPGLGRLLVDSIARRDYPVIQGGTLVIALLFVIANLAVDFAYSFLDPRIRFE